MNKPICPYCPADEKHPGGTEMKCAEEFDHSWHFWCPTCGSTSPEKPDYDSALAAALQRYVEPNRVFTLEELRAMEMPCALWMEFKGRDTKNPLQVLDSVGDVQIITDHWLLRTENYMEKYRFWIRRPTDAERGAVTWG